MLSFEQMVLPEGETVDSMIKENLEEIATIGASNAKFVTVKVAGMRFVDINPGVKQAWVKHFSRVENKR